ncbi:MAG TPA: ketoacyl-ACP synthase III [Candidatus Limnocylindria bacterium]|nr:ketoacyl-ACP synthase III [Candidatus Limnocylindria bacterium]
MQAILSAVHYHLPEQVLTNRQLAEEFPDWTIDRIEQKTGIRQRHIAGPGECASDLGVEAARKLFAAGAARPEDIDFLLFCTQGPDYLLPTTACLVQERLGLPRHAGALDFNLGCSGFVYGLGLAKGLIETEQARNVLLITAEAYSKFLHPSDRGVRTIFGDGAAATLLTGVNSAGPAPAIGPFVFGTDGRGAENLMVRAGAMRHPLGPGGPGRGEEPDGQRQGHLRMNGPEIFNFALEVVPQAVGDLLGRAGKVVEDVDLYVFHQANRHMLEHLRKKLGIRPDRFALALEHCGNTVSSSIPIALREAFDAGQLRPGALVMLVGFGVGYSWAASLLRWML